MVHEDAILLHCVVSGFVFFEGGKSSHSDWTYGKYRPFFFKPECFLMIQLPAMQADVDNTATWAKYSKNLCEHCAASCCSLPVEVKPSDLVRMELMDEFELQAELKQVARRLMKLHMIDHFHSKSETFTLARMANGDCIFLERRTRRCTIYSQRPETCRNHPLVGPRSGYCAFKRKVLG